MLCVVNMVLLQFVVATVFPVVFSLLLAICLLSCSEWFFACCYVVTVVFSVVVKVLLSVLSGC